MGFAYLWPGKDPRVRHHRRLWWRSGPAWPRVLWLGLEVLLWLRWQLVHAGPASRRALARFGATVARAEGIPPHIQQRRVIALARRWCIAPAEAYYFGLYHTPEAALDYVFAQETQAYHATRSAGRPRDDQARALLRDKATFADFARALGIRCPQTLALVSPGGEDIAPLHGAIDRAGRVFCKLNKGHAGRGAFTAWREDNTLRGRLLNTSESNDLDGNDSDLDDDRAVRSAWRRLLAADTVLIQPCLRNHPRLATVAWRDETITIRVLTGWSHPADTVPPTAVCRSAVVEIAISPPTHGGSGYAVQTLDPLTGKPGDMLLPLAASTRLLDSTPPHWVDIHAQSLSLQGAFPDLVEIAWDWVITPEGPVLLEGNSNWGPTLPQMQLGGLLAVSVSTGP